MKRKTPCVQKPASIYERIREILESAKTSVARSVNTTQVLANWLIGREIVEEEQRGKHRAGYGQTLVSELSKRLREEYGRGYSAANLWLFRQFFVTYPNLVAAEILYAPRRELAATANAGHRGSVGQASSGNSEIARAAIAESSQRSRHDAAQSPPMEILYAARSEFTKGGGSADHLDPGFADDWQPGHLHPNLSWTHYRTLLRVEKPEARSFYEIEAIENRWSARELERQINSLLYERLALSKDKKGLMRLATKGQEIQQPIDIFKDPVVMEFLGLPESHRLVETDLEQKLIDNLQTFLLELGKGFAFVARQQRLTLEGDHFYVDLVFYHTILKCYVLIDLNTGKLTHEDLGQLQLYVNYYDRERRTEGDQPTLGLILCTDKNDTVVKYTLGPDQQNKIFASRYKLHLPSEKELEDEIRREVRFLTADEPKHSRRKAKP
jgi:predicted nuclease of restriction endonuclease-like (RecB) superfamily